MLAFTLSKMNLLILVTALFAIVAYFMFGLTNIIVANEAQQIVNAKAESALGIVHSDKLCFNSQINMPYSIKYFGGTREFFYAMQISRYPEQTVQGQNNTLIFAIANRIRLDKKIAAQSIDMNAELVLFEYDARTGTVSQKPSILIDPHAENPINSFVLVKEVFKGKKYLFVIACSFSAGLCESNKAKVYDLVKSGSVSGVESHDSVCLKPGDPDS